MLKQYQQYQHRIIKKKRITSSIPRLNPVKSLTLKPNTLKQLKYNLVLIKTLGRCSIENLRAKHEPSTQI